PTARSSCPSPLTSATATKLGWVAVVKSCLATKVPLPLPSKTLRVLRLELGTTRSSLPSPLRSASATLEVPVTEVKLDEEGNGGGLDRRQMRVLPRNC